MSLSNNGPEPVIECLFSSPNGDVIARPSDLAVSIPLSLPHMEDTPGACRDGLTYAQYFEIIRTYLSHNDYEALLTAYEKRTKSRISIGDVELIRIRSEKHGDVYHIASIDILAKVGLCRLALATAISDAGKSCLANDFARISHLNSKHGFSYLPRMYTISPMRPPMSGDSGVSALFVLGDWLEGYHEFHWSIDPAQNRQKVILWDTNQGHKYLSARQSYAVYRQIAKILTLYYDVNTFEEISAWHHAAGDFVVCERGEGIDVGLVTVRDYAPMIRFAQTEETNKAAALLHFFAHLSLRMRLDRLDGIGKPAWADELCPRAVVHGFREALDLKEAVGDLTSAAKDEFHALLKALAETDWLEILVAVVNTYPQADADFPLIEANLAGHARELHRAISDQSA